MSGAEFIVAGTAALGSIGGGIAWLWDKIDKRFREIEAKLAACEEREGAGLVRRERMLTAIELMWQEIERVAPGSVVLLRVKKLLADLKQQYLEESGVDRAANPD